eukprot:scaffold32101_cov50-Attheya_sp.AAC.2
MRHPQTNDRTVLSPTEKQSPDADLPPLPGQTENARDGSGGRTAASGDCFSVDTDVHGSPVFSPQERSDHQTQSIPPLPSLQQ